MLNRARSILAVAIVLGLHACGGGGDKATYTVGGAASGLTGAGLILTLNGTNDLAVGGTGSFTFATPLADGTSYTVAVKTQPVNPSQTCVVSNATGTVSGAAVANVSVACTVDPQPVGGTVSGLAGTGLVLRLNGSVDLPVAANGAFSFPGALGSGSNYALTIRTQPTAPSQTCIASPAAGVVGATAVVVAVTCTTDTFAVGVNVSGLLGSGLTLQLNGGNDLPIGANGRYEFATRILRGAGYAVTVKTPSGRFREKCLLGNATRGNLQADAIVNVSCTLLDGFLYVVDFSRRLQAYGILPTATGDLVPLGAVGSLGNAANASFGTRTPDGKTLYVVDNGTSSILPFSIDPSSGALTPRSSIATHTAPDIPMDAAVAPSGRFLYVSNALSKTIVRFTIDPATGELSSRTTVATLAVAGTNGQVIAITPNGAFLYVLSFRDDFTAGVTSNLAVYAIDAITGALAPGPTIAAGTSSRLSIDPLGRFLYAQGVLNQAPFGWPPVKVQPYSIDAGTGALAAVSSGHVFSSGYGWAIEPTGKFAYYRTTGDTVVSDNYLHAFELDASTGDILGEIDVPTLVPGDDGRGFIIVPANGFGPDRAFLFALNRTLRGSLDGLFSFGASTFRVGFTHPGRLSTNFGFPGNLAGDSGFIVAVP